MTQLVKVTEEKIGWSEEKRVDDTACGATADTQMAADFEADEEERLVQSDIDAVAVQIASQRRQLAMMESLRELEARNAELEVAIKNKDFATMDKHIAYHQEQGNVAHAIGRQSLQELHKLLVFATYRPDLN